MADGLFDEEFFRKLELLELSFRRMQAQHLQGRVTSTQRGGRIEFADHRTYAPGDDPRYLDWNLYARTERLFTKEFSKDEELQAVFLLDASASMAWGAPSKWDYARQVAAAIAFIALAGENGASGAVFADGTARWTGVARARGDFAAVLNFLKAAPAGGATSIVSGISDLAAKHPRPCLAVLISDLLDERDPRGALGMLAARGFDLTVIHVLSPEEIHPPWTGPRVLSDVESRARRSLVLDGRTVSLYLEELEKFREGWQAFCAAHQILYFPVSTGTPFEELILQYLRRGGMLK